MNLFLDRTAHPLKIAIPAISTLISPEKTASLGSLHLPPLPSRLRRDSLGSSPAVCPALSLPRIAGPATLWPHSPRGV